MRPSAQAFAADSCSDLLVFPLDMNNAPFVIDSVFISLSLIKGAYQEQPDGGGFGLQEHGCLAVMFQCGKPAVNTYPSITSSSIMTAKPATMPMVAR